MPFFESRQVGRALVGVAVVQALIGLGLLWVDRFVGGAILAVAVLTPWLFATLTVTVTDESVSFRFGPGSYRRTIPLDEIRTARVVTLPWYSGVGIHWTMNGMLYNVAFGPVVQLELTSGTRVNIGSAAPEAFAAAVREALGHRHTDGPRLPPAHGMPWPLVSAALIACLAIGVAAAVIWRGAQPIQAAVTTDAFVASGAGYTTSVPVPDIASVALGDSLPHVTRRTNGFAVGARLRGHFVLDGVGPADVYVNRDVPPFVTVRSANGAVVVFNADTPDATGALFATLQARLKK